MKATNRNKKDTFKVWLHIERIPANGDEPESMDDEYWPEELGEFDSIEKALAAIQKAQESAQ